MADKEKDSTGDTRSNNGCAQNPNQSTEPALRQKAGSLDDQLNRETRASVTPPNARSTPPQGLAGTGAIYSAFTEAQVTNNKLTNSGRVNSESPLDTGSSLDSSFKGKLLDARKSHSRTGSENSELEAALNGEHARSNWKTPPRAMSPIEFEASSPESALGSIETSTKSSGSGRSSNLNTKVWKEETKGRLTPPSGGQSSRSRPPSDKKEKSTNWYNVMEDDITGIQRLVQVLSPSYKSRSEDFKKLFKDVPAGERLIVDYSCAMQKDILVHGRLYVTQNWICFYANIFRWETVITIRCKDIQAITKEKTARVIPNAIQIMTDREKYFFTSFAARDKSFLMLFRVWQNALMDQPMSAQELWQWVHYCYGDELGLTSSDDDYIAPNPEETATLGDKLGIDGVEDQEEQELREQDDLADSSFNGDPPLITGVPLYDNSVMATASMTDDFVPSGAGAAEPKRRKPIPPKTLPVPSPDATSGDIPTDMGDTTEDSDGAGEACCEHEHTGSVHIDKVFHVSVDILFDMLFTHSSFMKAIQEEDKTFDVTIPPWPDETTTEGHKEKWLNYTITSTFSFGPKHIISTEKQTLHNESKEGYKYIVDSECFQQGIPYGDSFYIFNQYCLTKVSKHRCRLRVHCEVKYKKTVWGLVKSIIVKNCNAGINNYFGHLERNLHKELDKASAIASGAKKKKVPTATLR